MPNTERKNSEDNSVIYKDFTDLKEAVIAKLEEWFQMIESGEANGRMPDPTNDRYDEEYIDKTIKKIDDFIKNEVVSHSTYWKGIGLNTRNLPITEPADFDRLKGAAREAFVQDLLLVYKGNEQRLHEPAVHIPAYDDYGYDMEY